MKYNDECVLHVVIVFFFLPLRLFVIFLPEIFLDSRDRDRTTGGRINRGLRGGRDSNDDELHIPNGLGDVVPGYEL